MQTRVLQPLYGGDFTTESGPIQPFVLPGELLETTPFTLLEPSPARTAPGCVHFGVCGGCSYQHAIYPEQLLLKQRILEGLLLEAGLSSLPEIEVLSGDPAAGQQWGYRNRIRLRVRHFDSAMQLGYSQRGTNHFLPIRMCPIAAPLLWRAAEALLACSVGSGLAQRWLHAVEEVELFTTPDQSRLQILFLLGAPGTARQTRGGFSVLCDLLRARLPELAGAGADLDPELSRRERRNWQPESWGAPGLQYPADNARFWVTRGAFFQVNRFLIDALVELVCEQTPSPPRMDLAWDLFAGVGLFSRRLAQTFARVEAVEGAEIASTDLAQAARGGTDARPFTAIRASTLDFLASRRTQRDRPDLVVLDPPRAGLGTEAASLLAAIAPAAITYVSCDPTTLARDLAVLARTYTLARITLVDMFPQTFHLETVVHLTRRP